MAATSTFSSQEAVAPPHMNHNVRNAPRAQRLNKFKILAWLPLQSLAVKKKLFFLETNLASRWEGVRLPRASGKSPDFPGNSPNLGEGKWGRKKCRRIPKRGGDWQGRVPKCSLPRKPLQNKRFGAPNFWGISPELFAALYGIHPYTRTSPWPRTSPGSFSVTSPEVLSLWNLTAIQRVPGSFPTSPEVPPNFPGSSRTSRRSAPFSGRPDTLSWLTKTFSDFCSQIFWSLPNDNKISDNKSRWISTFCCHGISQEKQLVVSASLNFGWWKTFRRVPKWREEGLEIFRTRFGSFFGSLKPLFVSILDFFGGSFVLQTCRPNKIALRDWTFQARLKISSEPPTTTLFMVGNSEARDWKISSEIKVFKWDWKSQARLFFIQDSGS